jgi:fructose-1-phosphate kinase PfkB-like protein
MPSLWISLSGSLPQGIGLDHFSQWLRSLKPLGYLAVDTSGPALNAAIRAKPDVIKPNQDELAAVGLNANQIWQQHGVKVLLSKGADGLEYHGPEGSFFQATASIHPVNTVGAGDATLAGFLLALAQGLPISEALALAAACGAANAEQAVAGRVDPARVEQLRQTIAPAQMIEVVQ